MIWANTKSAGVKGAGERPSVLYFVRCSQPKDMAHDFAPRILLRGDVFEPGGIHKATSRRLALEIPYYGPMLWAPIRPLRVSSGASSAELILLFQRHSVGGS